MAQHEVAVFIDADGSHEPANIPKLVAPIAAGQADLVIKMGFEPSGGNKDQRHAHGPPLRWNLILGLVALGRAR
jgi:glycosyltransferase involved in cell wall biosynthesis